MVGLGSERSSDRNTEQWGRLPTADEDTRGAIATPAQPTEEAYCKVLTRFDKLLVFNSEGDISRDSCQRNRAEVNKEIGLITKQ